MSVNTPNKSQSAAQGQETYASEQQAPAAKRSWSNLRAPGNMSRQATSDAFIRAKAAVTETLKEKSPHGTAELIEIDNSVFTNLRASALVLAISPADGRKTVAYHTLVISDTGLPPEPIDADIDGKKTTIYRFDKEIYDRTFASTVRGAIEMKYKGYTILDAAGQVVPRHFDWADRPLVYELVVSAGQAVFKELDAADPSHRELNLTEFNPAERLKVVIAFGQSDTEVLRQPIRTDLRLRLRQASNIPQQRQLETVNVEGSDDALLELGGFIDFLWAPEETPGDIFNAQPNTRKFAMRLVTTLMNNYTDMSLPSYLLGIVTLSAFGKSQNLLPAFLPRNLGPVLANGVDPYNIGRLAVEAGLPTPPDIRSANFQPTDLSLLFNSVVRPGVALAIDTDPAGPDTAFTDVFAAAVTDPAAGEAILRAADALTGGKFMPIYRAQFPDGQVRNPVLPQDEPVFLGSWTVDGRERDLREIDNYLFVSNWYANNPERALVWSDAVTRYDQRLEVRQEQRYNILADIAPSLKIRGTGKRVTLRQHFTVALAQAASEAGLSMLLENADAARTQFTSIRGNASSWVSEALLGPQNASVFNTTARSNTGAAVRGYGYSGRSWS